MRTQIQELGGQSLGYHQNVVPWNRRVGDAVMPGFKWAQKRAGGGGFPHVVCAAQHYQPQLYGLHPWGRSKQSLHAAVGKGGCSTPSVASRSCFHSRLEKLLIGKCLRGDILWNALGWFINGLWHRVLKCNLPACLSPAVVPVHR